MPDFSFDVYGQLIVRDPGAGVSAQRGAVLSHNQEMQAVSTVTISGGKGDTENTSNIPVTQQPIVVMEPPLSGRDGRKSETGSPGPGSGAGHEVTISSGHRDDVTCTPPRHKPFVPDPKRQVYLTGLLQSTEAAYDEMNLDLSLTITNNY